MKIAVVGCLHGELDTIYEKIENIEKDQNITIDLVLVCGDVQTIRNENDLKCISVPPKYRCLGNFHQYYFGDKIAPKLTLLIGGNHEASNYFQTLPYGGWVAPNIYYLGYCSVVRYGSVRIGGISGIFKHHSSKLRHFECLPYNEGSLRSIYHMREIEIYKLLQLQSSNKDNVLDVFLSHDWPINIHQCTSKRNVDNLLKRKPHFRQDIEQCRFGNPLLQPLVNHLKPKYWFAAHMHVSFNVNVSHSNDNTKELITTEFQALDKVVPRRHFLQVVDIVDRKPSQENHSIRFEYDKEWLAILRKTNHLWNQSHNHINGIDIYKCANEIQITENDIEEVVKLFDNNFLIPKNFERCKPVLDKITDTDPTRQTNYTNPQTTSLCSKLDIWDPNEMFTERKPIEVKNPDEIELDDSDDEDEQEREFKSKIKSDLFIIDTKGTLT